MKLLDAKKVEKITWEEPKYYDPLNVLTEVRDKIRALPEVEAIPIKWMKQKYGAAVDLDSTKFISKVNLLDEIIEEWRKEK